VQGFLFDEHRSRGRRTDRAKYLFQHTAVVDVVATDHEPMTTVELSQHTITLVPPQRLLMLEVTSEGHGLCLRMFPAGGVEVNDLRLVSKTPVPASMAGAGDGTNFDVFDSMAMMRRLSEAFPQLAEIDVRKVPPEYDITFGQVASSFRFESGERYRISGVGEHVWEATAIAK
jgi:hypothetical protein